MSALVAIVEREGAPADAALADAMLAVMPYRAPAGRGVVVSGSAALGAGRGMPGWGERLVAQPYRHPRGCVVVADCRLDNRDALLAALAGELPPDAADVEIIASGYLRWGEAVVERLLGDFAFVVWDPAHERLLCARDGSGQRELYYRLTPERVVAASQLQAIVVDPRVPIVASEARIRAFLTPQQVFRNDQQHRETFYAGIELLPAGHLLVVERDTSRLRRYWRLEPGRELRYPTLADYGDHLRELLVDATSARLRAARAPGVLLSGGLDSGSVACVAQLLIGAGEGYAPCLTTFTSEFAGLPCDERPYVESIAARYPIDARFVAVDSFGGRLQPEPAGFLDGPVGGARGERDALLDAVDRAGVDLLLTGDVADACVLGTSMVFDALLRQLRLRELRRRLRHMQRTTDVSPQRALVMFGLVPLLPLALQRQVAVADVRRTLARNRTRMLPGWLAAPLRDEVRALAEADAIASERERRFRSPGRHSEVELLDPPAVAAHPAPWPMTVARPFADRRLHEFLLAIPPEVKFRPASEEDSAYAAAKAVLRDAMRDVLPELVRTRGEKTIFSSAVASELQRNWELYATTFGPGSRPELVERGIVDRERFWERLQRGRDGFAGSDTIYLLRVIGLESWLRSLRLPRERLCAPLAPLLPSPVAAGPRPGDGVLSAAAGGG